MSIEQCGACGSDRPDYFTRPRDGYRWRFGILPERAECTHVFHAAARINLMVLRATEKGTKLL